MVGYCLTGRIPVAGRLIGAIVGVVGGAVELYSVIGIALFIIVFLDILKD